jgi:HlyD family secretion protein
MKRRIPLLVVVALALAAYGFYRLRQGRAPFEWSGTVEARTIEIGSRVGGRVEQVHVREGDTVAAAQAIITLEKGDLPAQRLIAQGQLTQAESALEKIAGRTLPTTRRAEIAEAEARLQAQQATQQKARMDEDRMRKLFTGGAATRADADNATLQLRSADAQVAASRAQLATLLQGTPQDAKGAQGLVDAARGRLQ